MMRALWNIVLCLILMSLLVPPLPATESRNETSGKELVVLLHGLSRTSNSMKMLERALIKEGYSVLNLNYRSRNQYIENMAEQLDQAIIKTRKDPEQRIHFVTHSLGGLILRSYLHCDPQVNVGRVVMLSPPNKGTELADLLKKYSFLSPFAEYSRGQLGTSPEDVPALLGPVHFELGVITGNFSVNPLFSSLLPGQDDGMVSVESTKVKGMKDFLVVPSTHTFIMMNGEVIRQTILFLKGGSFDHTVEKQ